MIGAENTAVSFYDINAITSSDDSWNNVLAREEINKYEKVLFHKKVIILTVTFLLISVTSFILGFNSIVISLSLGLSLANILLIIGKLQQL